MLKGSQRAEFYWEGARGTGAKLASSLRGWEHLRFEVTEDAGLGSDGGRWMHTPDLGIFFAQTDTVGNVVIPEDRIRYAMDLAGSSPSNCTANCASRLGRHGMTSSRPSATQARARGDLAPQSRLSTVLAERRSLNDGGHTRRRTGPADLAAG